MMQTMDHFIQTLEKKRGEKSVAKPYKHLLRKFESWLTSQGKTIDDFTATDVELFMSELKPSTANVFLSGIREYARFRVDNAPNEYYVWEDRRYHSLQSIRPLRNPRKIRKESLTPAEVARLLDLTSDYEPLHAGTVCLFYFGWRPVEATVNLADAEISWKKRYIKLRTAKAGHERLLPWAEEITPYLRAWRGFVKSKLVKYRYPEEWLSKRLKLLSRLFDVSVTAKTGRKTVETQLRKAGVEQWMINFLLGHSVKIPDIYSDWVELLEDLRGVMEERHYLLELIRVV